MKNNLHMGFVTYNKIETEIGGFQNVVSVAVHVNQARHVTTYVSHTNLAEFGKRLTRCALLFRCNFRCTLALKLIL